MTKSDKKLSIQLWKHTGLQCHHKLDDSRVCFIQCANVQWALWREWLIVSRCGSRNWDTKLKCRNITILPLLSDKWQKHLNFICCHLLPWISALGWNFNLLSVCWRLDLVMLMSQSSLGNKYTRTRTCIYIYIGWISHDFLECSIRKEKSGCHQTICREAF